jgi:hypothetical protein
MTGVRLEKWSVSMNKREFLAVGGAVPLMLAGCGGSGTGSAPVRLVNASVGYPNLGFMVESTQATSADVAYGHASPYENVQAGAVGITLTVGNNAATSAQTRTVNKDQRYSLIAFGYLNELKPLLLAESTTTPDTGKANINVLNTSVDMGAVDVYLSATADLSVATQIGTSVGGVSQSAFTGVLAGAYFITVVGAGSVQQGISDVRFQTPQAVTLTALKTYTVVLTPGASGVLANAIIMTQGTADAASPTAPYDNTTARVRAVTAVPGKASSVVGATAAGAVVTVLSTSTTQKYSKYFVVHTGTAPTVTVDGAAIAVVMDSLNSTTGVTTQVPAVLQAGGDYTILVYLDGSGNPVAKLVEDNNTAAVTSAGVKFRLINLASDNQGLELSMSLNGVGIASNVPYGTASDYHEVPNVPQGTASQLSIENGAASIITKNLVVPLGNVFTEIVVSVPATGAPLDFFGSASGN